MLHEITSKIDRTLATLVVSSSGFFAAVEADVDKWLARAVGAITIAAGIAKVCQCIQTIRRNWNSDRDSTDLDRSQDT